MDRKADWELNTSEAIKRLTSRLSSFKNYFGADSEAYKRVRNKVVSLKDIFFEESDSKIFINAFDISDDLQRALIIVPITKTYISQLKQLLLTGDSLSVMYRINGPYTKEQIVKEANAQAMALNRLEQLFDAIFAYLKCTDYPNFLKLLSEPKLTNLCNTVLLRSTKPITNKMSKAAIASVEDFIDIRILDDYIRDNASTMKSVTYYVKDFDTLASIEECKEKYIKENISF